MKFKPTNEQLASTHPFDFKSKGKKRHLCKKCGHTIRHWKHRLFRYPEGSVERLIQDDSTRIKTAIVERLAKPSPYAALLGSKKQLDMLTSPLTDKCPKCGFELVRYIREGSGEVFGCGACKTEWTRIGIHNAMLESLAGTKSNDPGMTRHEVTETGAIRSTAYPKGAKFPARYDLMMRNAAGQAYSFSREQLRLIQIRSEIDWLHAAEECPLVIQSPGRTSRSIPRKRELLALWIKLGRPHPVILRDELLRGVRVGSSEIVELCSWSWEMAAELSVE